DNADRRALVRETTLGLFITERSGDARPEDVLVRRVPGVDGRSGALAIDDPVPVGMTVQVHASDARSAAERLQAALAGEAASGAFVFTGGRRDKIGPGVIDHDLEIIDGQVNRGSIAGSGGDPVIGPVGDESRSHES